MTSAVPTLSNTRLLVVWIAALGAAGVLGVAGYLKITDHAGDVELFTLLKMEPFGRYVIGAIEILCAVLLVRARSQVYGALLGLGVMTGAIIGHLTVIGPRKLWAAAVVFTLCAAVLWLRRHQVEFLRNLVDHYDYDKGA